MLYEKPVYQNLLETFLVKLQMKELSTPDIVNPSVKPTGSIPLVLVEPGELGADPVHSFLTMFKTINLKFTLDHESKYMAVF